MVVIRSTVSGLREAYRKNFISALRSIFHFTSVSCMQLEKQEKRLYISRLILIQIERRETRN
jgi:hypothetical protein